MHPHEIHSKPHRSLASDADIEIPDPRLCRLLVQVEGLALPAVERELGAAAAPGTCVVGAREDEFREGPGAAVGGGGGGDEGG